MMMLIVLNKTATLMFWLLALLVWSQGWGGYLGWLPVMALVVLGVHVLEVLYFWVAFRKDSHNPLADAVQILVFGIFHLRRFIEQRAQ
ncbi:DUF1145 domain-containing protein [Venatoribacter cucullus]|nr:DUF1145 domain-containing protein [Venatoribacter cucullus]